MPTNEWYFPSLRDLWTAHAETVRRGQVEDLGFPGATLPATVLFVDAGDFTRKSNLRPGVPALAAFIATHFARLIENWAVGYLKAAVRSVYIDKIVGDAVLLVIPGTGAHAVTLGLHVAREAILGNDIYAPKVGIHAGDVLLADVGLPARINRTVAFEQITVMGPVVNLAQRLSGIAGAKGIGLLGEPMDELGLRPIELPARMPGLVEKTAAPESACLKGFRLAPVRVRRLEAAPGKRASGVDVHGMFARVAEAGSRLPRIDVVSR